MKGISRPRVVLILLVVLIVMAGIFLYTLQRQQGAYENMLAVPSTVSSSTASPTASSTTLGLQPNATGTANASSVQLFFNDPVSSAYDISLGYDHFLTINTDIISTNVSSTQVTNDPLVQSSLSGSRIMSVLITSIFPSSTVLGIDAYLNKPVYILDTDRQVPPSISAGMSISMIVSGCSIAEPSSTVTNNFLCARNLVPSLHKDQTPSYLISWTGTNGALITLTRATLDTFNPTSSLLGLYFDIKAGYAGFCANALTDYGVRVITDEFGDVASPTKWGPSYAANNCIDAGGTLTDQPVYFMNLPTSTPPTIVGIFDENGKQQTSFTINTFNETGTYMDIEPAVSQ